VKPPCWIPKINRRSHTLLGIVVRVTVLHLVSVHIPGNHSGSAGIQIGSHLGRRQEVAYCKACVDTALWSYNSASHPVKRCIKAYSGAEVCIEDSEAETS